VHSHVRTKVARAADDRASTSVERPIEVDASTIDLDVRARSRSVTLVPSTE